jgi:hypothetical protein
MPRKWVFALVGVTLLWLVWLGLAAFKPSTETGPAYFCPPTTRVVVRNDTSWFGRARSWLGLGPSSRIYTTMSGGILSGKAKRGHKE